MPCRTVEKEGLTYIVYKRTGNDDYLQFKRICSNLAHDGSAVTDIVIDFADSKGIVSIEIGLLIRLVRKLEGSACALRIVAPPGIRSTLSSTNVDRVENLVLYENREQLVAQLKKAHTPCLAQG